MIVLPGELRACFSLHHVDATLFGGRSCLVGHDLSWWHTSVSFLLFDAAHATFCFHWLVGMCKLHMFGGCLKREGMVAAFLSQAC